MLKRQLKVYVASALAALGIALTCWWLQGLPAPAALGRLASLELPDDAKVAGYVRLQDGFDPAFVAEIALPSANGEAVCTQRALAKGPVTNVPEEVQEWFPKTWFSTALCHRFRLAPSQWEFVAVDKNALILYVRSQ